MKGETEREERKKAKEEEEVKEMLKNVATDGVCV